MALTRHRTRIVCTIGPASNERSVQRRLIEAGMNVARLNFSHADFDAHGRRIESLRAAAEEARQPLAIMADMPGPKIRIGELADEPVEVAPGDSLVLTTDDLVGDAKRMSVSFKRLPEVVHPGDTIFLNDGFVQLSVGSVEGSEVRCEVVVGGELRSKKGLNLPGIRLGTSAFTPRDAECLRFALEKGVDAVSQSFVEGPEDVQAVRDAARSLGHDPFVFAKIERSRALDRFDEILEAADGVMVARGDLGVEIPIEEIAWVQKDLIHRSNIAGKPVITATQMLESMTYSRRPTRAEATDVANAILDGTDAVMLSGESAIGLYPVPSVKMLAAIAETTEPRLEHRSKDAIYAEVRARGRPAAGDLVALSVVRSVDWGKPAALFVPTMSGATARSINRFRLPVWVTAVSTEMKTIRALLFSYGVHPEYVEREPHDWKAFARDWLARHGVEGPLALLTQGPSPQNPDANHRMEVLVL
jgi:pyruvate kinase